MFQRTMTAAGIAAWLAIAAPAAAAPTTMALTGRLTAAGGGPVSDGKYPVTFSLFKAAAGGTAVWTEPVAAIATEGGVFHHVVGAATPLTPAMFAGPDGAWLEVKVEPEPAMPRLALRATPFSVRAAVSEGLECSGCVGPGHLDPAVLQPYAKTSVLAKVATSGAYADLSGGPDFSAYAKVGELAKVAQSGAFADLIGAPKLAEVATTGNFQDLNNLPKFAKVGSACGTGLVVKGLAVDGSLQCVAALDPTALPPDALDEVSNKLLTNQFVDTFSAAAPTPIPDQNPNGATSTIAVGDIGVAQKLTVTIDVENSNLETIKITLVDPAGASHVLWDKAKAPSPLKKTFPLPDQLVSGDLGAWVGKNPMGDWKLTVIDSGFLNNGVDGKIAAWSVAVSTLSNKKVSADGLLVTNGGLKLQLAAAHPVACNPANLAYVYYNTANDTLYICNGKAFFPIPIAGFGTAGNATLNCKDLKTKDPAAPSGTYWIDPDGPSGPATPFQNYCDQSQFGGGWTMALKYSAGLGNFDPQALVKAKSGMDLVGQLNPAKSGNILSAGTIALPGATELLAVVYKGSVAVYTIGFSLVPGDLNATWVKGKFIKSLSSVDIADYDPSLVSLGSNSGRQFYVTHNHGGCPNDAGSLVVATGGGGCGWEGGAQFIWYHAGPSNWANFTSEGKKDGETLIVYVR